MKRLADIINSWLNLIWLCMYKMLQWGIKAVTCWINWTCPFMSTLSAGWILKSPAVICFYKPKDFHKPGKRDSGIIPHQFEQPQMFAPPPLLFHKPWSMCSHAPLSERQPGANKDETIIYSLRPQLYAPRMALNLVEKTYCSSGKNKQM